MTQSKIIQLYTCWLSVGIQDAVGLSREHDRVDPQSQHEDYYQYLRKEKGSNIGICLRH